MDEIDQMLHYVPHYLTSQNLLNVQIMLVILPSNRPVLLVLPEKGILRGNDTSMTWRKRTTTLEDGAEGNVDE